MDTESILNALEKLDYNEVGQPKIHEESKRSAAAIRLALKRIKDQQLKKTAEEKLWQVIFNDPSERVIKKAYRSLGLNPTHQIDLVSFGRVIDGL